MVISEKQAKQIAECIAFDIKSFIEEHRLEYEEWLKNNEESLDRIEVCNNG